MIFFAFSLVISYFLVNTSRNIFERYHINESRPAILKIIFDHIVALLIPILITLGATILLFLEKPSYQPLSRFLGVANPFEIYYYIIAGLWIGFAAALLLPLASIPTPAARVQKSGGIDSWRLGSRGGAHGASRAASQQPPRGHEAHPWWSGPQVAAFSMLSVVAAFALLAPKLDRLILDAQELTGGGVTIRLSPAKPITEFNRIPREPATQSADPPYYDVIYLSHRMPIQLVRNLNDASPGLLTTKELFYDFPLIEKFEDLYMQQLIDCHNKMQSSIRLSEHTSSFWSPIADDLTRIARAMVDLTNRRKSSNGESLELGAELKSIFDEIPAACQENTQVSASPDNLQFDSTFVDSSYVLLRSVHMLMAARQHDMAYQVLIHRQEQVKTTYPLARILIKLHELRGVGADFSRWAETFQHFEVLAQRDLDLLYPIFQNPCGQINKLDDKQQAAADRIYEIEFARLETANNLLYYMTHYYFARGSDYASDHIAKLHHIRLALEKQISAFSKLIDRRSGNDVELKRNCVFRLSRLYGGDPTRPELALYYAYHTIALFDLEYHQLFERPDRKRIEEILALIKSAEAGAYNVGRKRGQELDNDEITQNRKNIESFLKTAE